MLGIKKKGTRKGIAIIASLVLFLPPISCVFLTASYHESVGEDVRLEKISELSYELHSPISISNNSDFETQGYSGAGTVVEPYVIQGYNITVSENTDAIKVNGTDVHFEIRHCYLNVESYSGNGIDLENVTNSRIWNCTVAVSATYAGVYLNDCTFLEVENNTFVKSYYGVHVEKSHNIIVDENIIEHDGDGIFLSVSESITVTDNYIIGRIPDMSDGICLDSSNYSTIMNNEITNVDYGILLYSGSFYNDIIQNNCTPNGSGILMYGGSMFNEITENLCDGLGLGQSAIKIVDSTSNIATQNICHGFRYGVLIARGNQSTIQDNTFYDLDNNPGNAYGIWVDESQLCILDGNNCTLSEYGIFLDDADHNDITNNILSRNEYSGIRISDSDWNTLSGNVVKEGTNTDFGIKIEGTSYFNDFNHNDIINHTGGFRLFDSINGSFTYNTVENTVTPLFINSGSENNTLSWNLFDNYTATDVQNDLDTIDYNYWSEYHGPDNNGDGYSDTPYSLISMNEDPHPLIYKPINPKWAHDPLDVYLEYPSDVSIDLEVDIGTQGPPEDYWWISDTDNFYLDENNTVRSNTQLDIGTYPLQIRAYNMYGFYVDASISVFIQDTTFPEVSHPDDLTYEEGTTGHILTWTGFDLAPASYSITLDGTITKNGAWNSSSDSISFSVDNLAVGGHTCFLFLTDRGDNTVNSTVIVTVTAIPTTTTTTTTETTTDTTTSSTTTDSQPPDNTLLILAIGIGIGVIASVVVLIVSRRR